MRTVDNPSDPNENRWVKLRRDFRLMCRLGAMTVYYFTKGRQMRAAYRRCEMNNEIYYVDDDPAEPERRVR